MFNFLLWLVYFIPAILIEWFCWVTNPLVCLFTRHELRTDWSKRLHQVCTLQRDYLVKPFYLWQTHDNAVDEGWYGLYNIPFLSKTTQYNYDNSALIRYWCRLWWLSRNTAYGWHYKLFSKPVEDLLYSKEHGVEYTKKFWYLLKVYKHSWQFECQIPLFGNRYCSTNIGWKAHKNKPNKLYANRLIGLRRYE